MAPRKTAKQPDSEDIEKAANAGEVSPQKRRKIVARTTDKNEAERPVRLPRAAKSKKNDETEITADSSGAPVVTKETKSKKLPAKNPTVATKPAAKVKPTTKKSKDVVEDAEDEKKPTKSQRVTRVEKKAGIDEETEKKPKGRSKKNMNVEEATEDSKVPTTKKGRVAKNTEATLKEDKPKAKATEKKADVSKSKVSNNRKKPISGSDEASNANEIEEAASKPKKKINNDKPVKPAAKNSKAKKMKITNKNLVEGEEETEVGDEIPLEPIENGSENILEEEVEAVQEKKKTRNTKNKGESVSTIKAVKSRGKAANRDADAAINEDVSDNPKADTISQKVNKENSSSATALKKGRGKEIVGSTLIKEEKIENVNDERRTINSLKSVVSNNNKQELFEQILGKESEEEEEDETDITDSNIMVPVMDKSLEVQAD